VEAVCASSSLPGGGPAAGDGSVAALALTLASVVSVVPLGTVVAPEARAEVPVAAPVPVTVAAASAAVPVVPNTDAAPRFRSKYSPTIVKIKKRSHRDY
jgi:hypothetical protein